MSDEVRICTSCWEEDCVCDYEQYTLLDTGIADAIISMNTKGYKTLYCCEGHIYPDDGTGKSNVMDIYVNGVKRYETLPEGFSYPKGKQHNDFHHTVLYKYVKGKLYARINGKYVPYDLEKDRQGHLTKLKSWADALPAIDLKKHPECYSDYMVTGKPKASYLNLELPPCKTHRRLVSKEEYPAIADYIIGYGGKILDIQECDGQLLVSYWSHSNNCEEPK